MTNCPLPRCTVCKRPKKPLGRDAGIAVDSYCHDAGGRNGQGCPGYLRDPRPLFTWPGEES